MKNRGVSVYTKRFVPATSPFKAEFLGGNKMKMHCCRMRRGDSSEELISNNQLNVDQRKMIVIPTFKCKKCWFMNFKNTSMFS